jgi:signal transduction histidine kinase
MEGPFKMNVTFWLGTIIMLFLALGLITLVIFYQKKFLLKKQKEAELLLKTALESEKKERERIAKDLHDSVQSDLSAIQNFLFLIQKSRNEESVIELMEETKTALQQTIANTRMISYQLMPPLLETRGFIIALQDYFEQINKSQPIQFELKCHVNTFEVSTKVGYELFRIYQEFTNNMVKYSKAKQCTLFVYQTNNGFSLELVDDGMPFSFYNHYKASKGLGLQNILSRVKSIQGALEQREVPIGNQIIIHLSKLP